MKKLKGYQQSHRKLMEKSIVVSSYDRHYDLSDLKNINFAEFDLDFMFRSVSRINRYLGHTVSPLSVGQHIVMGTEAFIFAGEIDLAMQFLFHDLAESLLGDVTKPIKKAIGENYEKMTIELETALCEHHNVTYPFSEEVGIMDGNLAQIEMTFLMGNTGRFEGFDYWNEQETHSRLNACYEMIKKLKSLQS